MGNLKFQKIASACKHRKAAKVLCAYVLVNYMVYASSVSYKVPRKFYMKTVSPSNWLESWFDAVDIILVKNSIGRSPKTAYNLC